jgi:hypothetical protein
VRREQRQVLQVLARQLVMALAKLSFQVLACGI